MENDLISRSLLRLMKTEECAGHTIDYAMGWKACIEWIKTLPSAQPDISDRKVGEWIIIKRHEHYPSGKPYEQVQCPFCKRFDNNGDGSFCGYCGALMKGEEDG